MVKHGYDLTLFDTWEFAVERRIDGEGTDFGQSVNEEHNGEELFHLSPLPACTGGLLSQDSLQMRCWRITGAETLQRELQAAMSGSENP